MTDEKHATHAHTSMLKKAITYIEQTQMENGAIPWYQDGKLDPWDHTEAAMALSVFGRIDAAERAYAWLAQAQLADGSWQAHYFVDDQPALRETNFVAYVATGVWHHFMVTQDLAFLQRFQPMVKRAINFVLRFQHQEGEIAWAINQHNQAENDALLTACCSILRSLECAVRQHQRLGLETADWQHAANKLKHAISHKPERFDRTWASKARFAMDWYYPILAGVPDIDQAQTQIQRRWAEFVEPNLGCRCVTDEPWVTMAETAELVIALVAANQMNAATTLFETLAQWQDEDGGFWTGYVFKDKTIWPEDKTTWTAGAVALAYDAIYKKSAAHGLFTARSLFAKEKANTTSQKNVALAV